MSVAFASTQAPLVEACGLGLSAPGRGLLVQGLDLRVQPGERWCVLGRNAVGKSTLLRALAGLPVPGLRGEVRWAGQAAPRWSPAEAARLRAYQPQTPSDRFGLSVRRLLELAVCSPPRADESDLLGLLTELDAADLLDRDVRQLSGGERQRVALAQCALQGTPFLLLDEPISFQDPAHQQLVGRWLTQLTATGQRSVVMTAHDVNWAASVATHVLFLLGDWCGRRDGQGGEPGAWAAGPVGEMLTAAQLQAAYGCAWREAGGVWVPVG
ncbi:ABC transporter ATP-binding protein [Aquabacterium sp.]|uniref:ABC transporter ATP-binding protein n=1 Tax=Aquabacterium sp. TaxID=1872578 RepID=UPI0035B0DDAD